MVSHSDAPVILYHGTTLRAANLILDAGWQPLSVTALLDRVAAEHELSASEIVDDLSRHGGYALSEDRGSWASFAPTLAKAEHSWAQRTPEAGWEALWAVYRRKFMSSAEAWYWNTDVAGRAWVWDQMRNEQLAVISFATSHSELAALGAFMHGFQRTPLGSDDLSPEVWKILPEIGFDLPFRPDPDRLTISPVERHLPWDIYAHKLGLAPEEFQRRAEKGDFGPSSSETADCQDNPFLVRPWWDAATAPLIA